MKLILLIALLFFSANLYSQKKNSITFKGNAANLYAFYAYGKYKKHVEVGQNPSLTYLRKINDANNRYLGLSIGLRTYSFNEFNSQLATELYYRYSNFNISLIYRKEDYLGRRNKIFIEFGLGLNTGINATVIDYFNSKLPSKKLGTSLEGSVYGGYQYMLNNKWKFEIGFLGQNDVLSNMIINQRKVKFVTSTLVTTLNYSF